MNVNLMPHRSLRWRLLMRRTQWRCCLAIVAGAFMGWFGQTGWLMLNGNFHAQAQHWQAQHQSWQALAQRSQTHVRMWSILANADVHGVVWTQWQQEGADWTLMAQAAQAQVVQDWVAQWAPSLGLNPVGSVRVTETRRLKNGAVLVTLSWRLDT